MAVIDGIRQNLLAGKNLYLEVSPEIIRPRNQDRPITGTRARLGWNDELAVGFRQLNLDDNLNNFFSRLAMIPFGLLGAVISNVIAR